MMAQAALSLLLLGVVAYAVNARRRSPVVASMSMVAAVAGLYFTWMPDHATDLALWAGVGRGVDLVLYIWVCITLIVLLNLHLKLRTQMELVTVLARTIALADVRSAPKEKSGSADNVRVLPRR
jgi:small membrane protein